MSDFLTWVKRKYFDYMFPEEIFTGGNDAAFERMLKSNWFKGSRFEAFYAGVNTGRADSPGKIIVGQYSITEKRHKEEFYIEHESGEGMSCDVDALEEMITQFYAENF